MVSDPERPDPPTGLPSEDEPEPAPLGTPDPEEVPEPGPGAMPGIVTEGDPPDAG